MKEVEEELDSIKNIHSKLWGKEEFRIKYKASQEPPEFISELIKLIEAEGLKCHKEKVNDVPGFVLVITP